MKKHKMIGLALTLAVSCQMAIMTGCGAGAVSETEDKVVVESTANVETETETTHFEENGGSDPINNEFMGSDPQAAIDVVDGGEFVIETAGTYTLSGQASNFTVKVEADEQDKVEIVLAGANIVNEDFPVVYVKSADKCTVTLAGTNTLSVTGEYVADGEVNTDAVIFAKSDLDLQGEGTLTIDTAYGNGITSKDDLEVVEGNYVITCGKNGMEGKDSLTMTDGSVTVNAVNDGVKSEGMLVVDGGQLDITAVEGLEATYIQINGGVINIDASDDGINAAQKSDAYEVLIEINGGEITVVMGPGDTDGIDANGAIIVNGGTIDITGSSAFDYDTQATYNGGTIIINGSVVDEIPQSMMGGHGGGPGFGGPRDGQMNPNNLQGGERPEMPEGMTPPEGMQQPGYPGGSGVPEESSAI